MVVPKQLLYENEPQSRTEAIKRASEKELWSAAEDCEFKALEALIS